MLLKEVKEATENVAFFKIHYYDEGYIIATAPLEYGGDEFTPRVFCSFFIGLVGYPVCNSWIYASGAEKITKITEEDYHRIGDLLKHYGYVYNKKTKQVYRKGDIHPLKKKDFRITTWK